MLPETLQNTDKFVEDLMDYRTQSSKSFRLVPNSKLCIGFVDGVDALIQTIDYLMSIDRYAYDIYDWYVGHELSTLVGESVEYAQAEIPRMCRDCLIVDWRINDVKDFQFTQLSIDTLDVAFTVESVYGDFEYNSEVVL